MPGGGKGPSSSGNITQTTINPTQQAQLPFLTAGFQHAQDLYNNNPLQYYPGQTLATFNPNIASGYNNLIGVLPGINSGVVGPGNDAFTNAVSGGYGISNSPAFAALNGIGTRTGGSSATLDALAQQDIQAGNEYAQEFGNFVNQGTGVGNQVEQLGTLSNAASNGGGQYANDLRGLGFSGSGATPYSGSTAAYGANAADDPYAGELEGMGTGRINGLAPGYSLLNAAGYGGLTPNLGTDLLAQTAGGAFLGKNPYIDAQYAAASNPVVRQYMTATAPQTDSNYEASGRYGSGGLSNARSQNEQDLGKTLGDLSATLYGQDYANERGLMTGAQGTLTDAIQRGLQIAAGAGEGIGNLGLGEFGARTGAINQAGNQYLTGQQLGIQGADRAAAILQNELAVRGQLLNEAGNQYQAGISNAGGLQSQAGNLRLGDYSARLQALQDRANAYNNGLSLAGQAYGQGGTLANNALSTVQSGYDTGNRNALVGLGLEPGVLNSNFSPIQQMIAGGQGLTSLDQAQIADQMARFYGNQQAPYQTLSQYMNFIGNPQTGSSTVTSPLLGPSPLSSGLATIGGLNSLFGSGGIGSSLFGGGGGLGLSASALGGLGGTAADGVGGLAGDALTGGGFFGPSLAEAGGSLSASAAPLALGLTVICTELRRQGKMPRSWYVATGMHDAAMPQWVRNGYHAWAVPVVRHMRNYPSGVVSKIAEKTFGWRSEDIAARKGVKGARRMLRGRLVTAAIAVPSIALGVVARAKDLGRELYGKERTA
ncbi:MAG TPA: hypothetical protein VF113_04745 [Stellaceae bacterium]